MNERSPIIVVADQAVTGHHPEALILYSREIARLGYEVWVLGPDPVESEARIRRDHPELAASMKFALYQTPPPVTSSIKGFRARARGLSHWGAFGRVLDRAQTRFGTKPDLIFFPFMDDFLEPLVTIRDVRAITKVPWTGVYMLPDQYRRPNKRQRYGFGALKSDHLLKAAHCPAVALYDEGMTAIFEESSGAKGIAIADPQNTQDVDLDFALCRQIRDVKGDRSVVILAGSLERRKGVFEFLQASQILAKEPYLFVAAGNLHRPSYTDEDLRMIDDLVKESPENLILSFERIPDEGAFNGLIESSDIVWIAYPQWPFSSGLLTKAAHLHRPVIVCDGYLLAERVRRHNLGEVVKACDAEDAVSALRKLRDRPIDTKGFDDFAALHSLDTLREGLGKVIAACLPKI